MSDPVVTAPAVLSIELTQGSLNEMVARAVAREVAQRMHDHRSTREMIRAEVAHNVRTVVQEIAIVEMPRIVTAWLEAREGWVAKMVMRAVRRGASAVPNDR